MQELWAKKGAEILCRGWDDAMNRQAPTPTPNPNHILPLPLPSPQPLTQPQFLPQPEPHNLNPNSQARLADRIVVMQHGAIAEEGSHAELVAKRGLYYEMLNTGTGDDDDELT